MIPTFNINFLDFHSTCSINFTRFQFSQTLPTIFQPSNRTKTWIKLELKTQPFHFDGEQLRLEVEVEEEVPNLHID
ncbi:hypothetical protein AQUCO_03400404v1 [Aquilegia coerulea]|uniref:Uncharacterized protein n=1 Tax=Aquilegia coerulea TaxID=218851 RepID=A0A2G5CYY2_AQUCA|nr:hypothetical protein AQUCO_03400404v1 [Aquilegia coerulea]